MYKGLTCGVRQCKILLFLENHGTRRRGVCKLNRAIRHPKNLLNSSDLTSSEVNKKMKFMKSKSYSQGARRDFLEAIIAAKSFPQCDLLIYCAWYNASEVQVRRQNVTSGWIHRNISNKVPMGDFHSIVVSRSKKISVVR